MLFKSSFSCPFQPQSAHPPELPAAPEVTLMKPVVQLLPYITVSNDSPPFIPLQAWLWLGSHPQPSAGCLGLGTVPIALKDFDFHCWSAIREETIWASLWLRAMQPGNQRGTKPHMRLHLLGTSPRRKFPPTFNCNKRNEWENGHGQRARSRSLVKAEVGFQIHFCSSSTRHLPLVEWDWKADKKPRGITFLA